MASRPPSASDTNAVLARLSTLRVAKDLFTTRWYTHACDLLLFDEETKREMLDIADETREEREHLMTLMEEWAARSEDTEREARVENIARVDFLLMLMRSKDAAGKVLTEAAGIAPPEFRDRLRGLADIDFEHARVLRRRLEREVEDAGDLADHPELS